MKSLLFKIGVGVSLGINLFMFAALLYNVKMYDKRVDAVSYTHLTLPTTPYV